MPKLLTLSRAARLVGVRRGALQKQIKAGKLSTFEGMISLPELLRVYPEAGIEKNAVLKRMEEIKEAAVSKRLDAQRILPSAEVLDARLRRLSDELGQAKSKVDRYAELFEQLRHKFRDLEGNPKARAAVQWLDAWMQSEWDKGQGEHADVERLLARDSMLRLMAAHVLVEPGGHDFFVEGAETLLEAALRAGLRVDYGCSDGSCGRCAARLISGETRQVCEPAPKVEPASGEVLMCCTTPVGDAVIEAREAARIDDLARQSLAARVSRMERDTGPVGLLELRTPKKHRLRFLAGQRASLHRDGEAALECAIANCPCEDRRLQFHVQHTHPLFADLDKGDKIQVEGPVGQFLLNAESHHSLVFLAFGTGFASVKGLIEQAQSRDDAEAMYLYWITLDPEPHYLDNLCRAWNDALDNFFYRPIIWLNGGAGELDALVEAIHRNHSPLVEYDYYLAGPARHIAQVRQNLLESGVPAGQCHSETLD